MRTTRHTSALLLGAVVMFGSVTAPSASHAADTPEASSTSTSAGPTVTSLTKAQVTTALETTQSNSVEAETKGWTVRDTASLDGADVSSALVVYAVSQGRGQMVINPGPTPPPTSTSMSGILVQHKGDYVKRGSRGTLGLPPVIVNKAMKIAGRPRATWIYQPNARVDLTRGRYAVTDYAPDTSIFPLLDSTQVALRSGSTRTAYADGYTAYDIPIRFVGEGKGEVTLLISPGGQLISMAEDFGDGSVNTVEATYGPQKITLPPAGRTVRWNAFTRALTKVARADAHAMAVKTAKRAVAASHGRAVTVGTIRATAVGLVRERNYTWGSGVFKRRPTTHGVRFLAINPLTGRWAAGYTVRAHGKRAVIRH